MFNEQVGLKVAGKDVKFLLLDEQPVDNWSNQGLGTVVDWYIERRPPVELLKKLGARDHTGWRRELLWEIPKRLTSIKSGGRTKGVEEIGIKRDRVVNAKLEELTELARDRGLDTVVSRLEFALSITNPNFVQGLSESKMWGRVLGAYDNTRFTTLIEPDYYAAATDLAALNGYNREMVRASATKADRNHDLKANDFLRRLLSFSDNLTSKENSDGWSPLAIFNPLFYDIDHDPNKKVSFQEMAKFAQLTTSLACAFPGAMTKLDIYSLGTQRLLEFAQRAKNGELFKSDDINNPHQSDQNLSALTLFGGALSLVDYERYNQLSVNNSTLGKLSDEIARITNLPKIDQDLTLQNLLTQMVIGERLMQGVKVQPAQNQLTLLSSNQDSFFGDDWYPIRHRPARVA